MDKTLGRPYFYKNFRDNTDIKISSSFYNYVIKKLHDVIIEELLLGNQIKLPYSLGTLAIKKSERKTALPNWGESNKNKAKILNDGGVPFEVLEKDEKGVIVKTNGGEKWLVYHTDPYYYELVWIKTKDTKYIPNSKYYRLKTLDTMKDKISGRMKLLTDSQKEILFSL